MATVCPSNLPEILDSPHQPGPEFKFPKHSFGKKTVIWQLFQPAWFRQWRFLHYDEANDLAYCHTCVKGFKEQKMRATKADAAFVSGHRNLEQLLLKACQREDVTSEFQYVCSFYKDDSNQSFYMHSWLLLELIFSVHSVKHTVINTTERLLFLT